MSPRIRRWLRTLICWDGILPLFVAAGLAAAVLFVPRQRDGISLAIALSVIAISFLVRAGMGTDYLTEIRAYWWQYLLFITAIFMLACLDSMMFVFQERPKVIKLDDWIVWLELYAAYLAMIGLALFPYRGLFSATESTSDDA